MVVTPPAAALRVDRAGQHHEARSAVPFAGGRAALRYVSDDAVGDQHIAVLDDPIRENDRPRKDLIRHELPFAIECLANVSAASLSGERQTRELTDRKNQTRDAAAALDFCYGLSYL